MIPDLTSAELERLAILSEELGEVQQIIGKILRHGYDSYNPYDKTKQTNRDKLEIEIGDVLCILDVMWDDNSDIDILNIKDQSIKKRVKLNKWMHYNKLKV